MRAIAAVGLWAWLHAASCMAQPTVLRGDTFPQDPAEMTWFFDTGERVASRFEGGKWQTVRALLLDSIYPCGGGVVMASRNFYEIRFRQLFLSSTPPREYYSFRRPTCGDSIAILYPCDDMHPDNTCVAVLDPRGSALAKLHARTVLRPHKLDGVDAYCVPQYVRDVFEASGKVTTYTWGMLGVDGRWLIAPVFDEAFTFRGGVAEVVYRGFRRKINERGEFVQ